MERTRTSNAILFFIKNGCIIMYIAKLRKLSETRKSILLKLINNFVLNSVILKINNVIFTVKFLYVAN